MKKQSVLMKQAVAPLQAAEVGIIRRKLASFDVRILLYVCTVCSQYERSCIVHCTMYVSLDNHSSNNVQVYIRN